jgi:hypothetical protein
MPLSREYASAAKPAPGSCVIVIDSIFDLSSHANVGSAKSPGTPKAVPHAAAVEVLEEKLPSGMCAGRREGEWPLRCTACVVCVPFPPLSDNPADRRAAVFMPFMPLPRQ